MDVCTTPTKLPIKFVERSSSPVETFYRTTNRPELPKLCLAIWIMAEPHIIVSTRLFFCQIANALKHSDTTQYYIFSLDRCHWFELCYFLYSGGFSSNLILFFHLCRSYIVVVCSLIFAAQQKQYSSEIICTGLIITQWSRFVKFIP